MADRIREFDWSRTPVGPMDRWPQSLRTAVSICLGSQFPMMIFWGPGLTNIYNDAFRSVLGGWHPQALGMSGRDVWADTWPVIGQQVAKVMSEGGSTLNERVRLIYTRHGFPEETWFTWSFGPIRDESGSVAGLFNTCHEDTQHVLAERERDRLLAVLGNERSRLAEIIRRAPAFICTMRGPDHVFEFVNERYHELAGRRDVIGRAVREVQPEIVGQGYLDILDRVYRTGEPFEATEMRLNLRGDDGTPIGQRYINVAWQALREADGSVSGVFIHGVDVTEQVRAREAVRESTEQLRLIMASVTDHAIFTLDLDGKVTAWNVGAERVFGYAADEMLGHPADVLFTPEDRANGRPHTEMRLATDGGRDGVADDTRTHTRKDGSRFFSGGSMKGLRDEAGTLRGFVKVVRDITDGKRAEQVLRESEQRFRALVTASSDALYRMSADWGEMRQMNGGAFIADTSDPSRGWLMQYIPPEEQPRVTAAIDEAIRTKSVFELEHRVRRADGTPGWTFSRAVPLLDGAGEITEWFGTAADLTDRRRAEAELAAVRGRLDAALIAGEVGTYEWEVGADRLYGDANFARIFAVALDASGAAPLDTYLSSIHPDDRERTARLIRRSVETGVDYETEYRVVNGDRERWVVARGRMIKNAAGKVVRFPGVILDITDRKRVEAERERLLESEQAARSEAERAGRMKDEFLATLSHELRTPLNAILGWSQIIRGSNNDPEDVYQGIEVIERNARAQSQIIEDLLDMSRIISGKVGLDVQRLDLSAIAQAAVATIRPTAEAKGVRLVSVIDPLHDVVVTGDANRLQQVLWNLLTNAVKFTPKGGRVQLLLERVNSHLEVSVIDTGEGIRQEFLPFVFDRFRQADASTTRRHGGLGLGLSIVKQLAELHGGSVRAKSAGLGHGTTFIVSLPLTVAHVETAPEPERRHPTPAPTLAGVKGACAQIERVRVLVIDDEPDARVLLKRLLEDCRAVVTATDSVDEVVRLVATRQFDVLVSDVGMPVEDGYVLIRRVRALGKERGGDIPAIALTAYARAEDRVKAVSAGFQMHVAKPVEAVELVTMVAGAAGRTGLM